MTEILDWEKVNLEFFVGIESQLRERPSPSAVIVTFALGDMENTPVTIRADYHDIFKDDKDVWFLDATPLESSILDYSDSKPILEFKPAEQDDVISEEAVVVLSDRSMYGVLIEDGISMPAVPNRITFNLSSVIAPVVRIQE